MSVLHDLELERLLAVLHARSDDQIAVTRAFYDGRVKPPTDDEIRAFRSDKLVALDPDKAEFCYQLCRANDARRVVEIGTSYGSQRSISRLPCETMFAPQAARAW